MNRSLPTIAIILFALSHSFAQPNRIFSRFYPDDDPASFRDVYQCENGDFIMAGEFITPPHAEGDARLVRVSANGDPVWNASLTDNPQEICHSVVETDGGNFIAVGGSWRGGEHGFAALMDRNGNRIWDFEYMPGQFFAVIELKSGEFLICGYEDIGQVDVGLLVWLNAEGEVIHTRRYEEPQGLHFHSMIETERGIALAGRVESQNPWTLMVDFAGNEQWQFCHEEGVSSIYRAITRSHDGAIVVAGIIYMENEGRRMEMVKLAVDGNLVWRREFLWMNGDVSEFFRFTGVTRLADCGFAIATYRFSENRHWPIVIRTDFHGEEMWRAIYEEGQGFHSVITNRYDQIVAAGWTFENIEEQEYILPWLIMLGYDRLDPRITNITPRGNDPDRPGGRIPGTFDWHEYLNVLTGRFIESTVEAFSAQHHQLEYLWRIDDDIISQDSTVTIQFDEIADHVLICTVSDGDLSTTAQWDVSVRDIIITWFSPDEQQFTIQCNEEIAFTIQAQTADEEPVDYRWLIQSDDDIEVRQIGSEETVHHIFDQRGRFIVTGQAYQGETTAARNWQIDVLTSMQAYYPDSTDLIAHPLDSLYFEMIPWNPESDSLRYLFRSDNHNRSEQSRFGLFFRQPGLHTVQGFLWDGYLADSVTWNVQIVAPDEAPEDELQPVEFGISSVSPNPFNSRTTIQFGLEEPSEIDLQIIDVNGRVIRTLIDSARSRGWHYVSFDAGNLPGGIYFVRLQAGNKSALDKLTLIR